MTPLDTKNLARLIATLEDQPATMSPSTSTGTTSSATTPTSPPGAATHG